MDHDSTDHPKSPRKPRRGQQPDLPSEGLASADVDPATPAAEEDDEARLPEALEEAGEIGIFNISAGQRCVRGPVFPLHMAEQRLQQQGLTANLR